MKQMAGLRDWQRPPVARIQIQYRQPERFVKLRWKLKALLYPGSGGFLRGDLFQGSYG